MVGRDGATVTTTEAVAVAPTTLVTVSVKVVVLVNIPVEMGAPLITGPTRLSIVAVPPVNTGVSVVLVPAVMLVAAAVKDVITGSVTTTTVWLPVIEPVTTSVAVTV